MLTGFTPKHTATLEEYWNVFTPGTYKNLVRSIPHRIYAVTQASGGHTKNQRYE